VYRSWEPAAIILGEAKDVRARELHDKSVSPQDDKGLTES